MLPAYAAVEIAARPAPTREAAGGTLLDASARRSFSTAIGTDQLRRQGRPADSPYQLFRFDGAKFVEAELP